MDLSALGDSRVEVGDWGIQAPRLRCWNFEYGTLVKLHDDAVVEFRLRWCFRHPGWSKGINAA